MNKKGSMENKTIGEFKKVSSPENSRTYIFPAGEVEIKNVAAVCVRPSGSHRIETATGEKYIVGAGWLAIKLDVKEWSF